MFKWLKKVIDWFKMLFSSRPSKTSRPLHTAPDPTTTGASVDIPTKSLVVRIIGPRGCGKTTYLGAILACPNRSPLIKNITAIGEESQRFEADAINVLAKGGAFLATPKLTKGIDELSQIRFSVTIDPGDRNPPVSMTIFSRDYSGEVLDDFALMDESTKQIYMSDCEGSQGILLLLDAKRYRKDFDYSIVIKRFVDELIATKADGWQGKIALALTKCEDLQIYTERKQMGSEKLIAKYFPKTLNALKGACFNRNIQIGYFSTSSFGLRGKMLEENVTIRPSPTDPNEKIACVKYSNIWRPFGLFAPLYWLATDNRFPPKDED